MTVNKQRTAGTVDTNLTKAVAMAFTPVEVEMASLRHCVEAMQALSDQEAKDRVLEYLNNRFGN